VPAGDIISIKSGSDFMAFLSQTELVKFDDFAKLEIA
jgi:hypothetical protein